MEKILNIFLGLEGQMLDRALCFVDETIPDDCSVVESSLIENDLEIVFKNENDEEFIFSKSFDFNNKDDRGDYNFIIRGIQPISRVV